MVANLYLLLPYQILILFILVFLLLLVAYFYFSLKDILFRISIFLFLIFLLLNPMINSIQKSKYDDLLILVSDKTKSITQTNKLKYLLDSKKNIKSKIKNIEELQLLEIEIDNLNNENNNRETDTKIFSQIKKNLQKIDKKRIAGIIIITDGIIHDLEKIDSDFLNIPIHFLLLGNKNERDRSILTENIPEYALVGKKINFLFNIKDDNFSDQIKASFVLDGQEVLNKSFLPNMNHNITLPISHAGTNLLEIRINNHEDEITFANNYKVFKINGIHEKLRVMLISGEPNMGLRNWRNILNSDPSIELLHFTILRPPSKRDLTPVKELALIPFPAKELFSADISKFSLIILDQYTLQGILPKKYLDNIVNYVVEGGAILNITGPEHLSEKSLIKSPLANILPTRPEKFLEEPFLPTLTNLGKRHPITNSLKQSYLEKDWGKWFSFVVSRKVSGETLLEANNYPLLVISEVLKGRVVQILSDQSWIWKKDLDNKGPIVKLLRNTVHWLLKTPELQENYLKVKKNNNTITLVLNTLTEGSETAVITFPSNKTIPVNMKDNKNGSLIGKFKSLELGKYNIKLNNLEKDFYIGITNNKEIEEVKSSEKLINTFFKRNDQFLHSKTWIEGNMPKIIKVYNKNNISGKNWIGLLEKRIEKNDTIVKKEFLNWIITMPLLLILLFVCWFREVK
ncbi:MAG: hypothetical protein CFH34_00393 [Alphaproteobacteria bacterium MarineAlpha9_Bin4]|nr:MAG: hypothetical protein CFH34_00393 [Alphaproteobacteria bacterium MarineAlpha9_Bin4]|tara:strand:+ start:1437 stop:3491 length:2055 start_codon:yes stop_codon:yes gene_type:complete